MGAEMALLVAEFTTITTHLLEDISRAAEQRDRNTIQLRAHTLRSSASSVGAAPLSALAAALEECASREGFADFGTASMALQTEFLRARAVLDSLCNGGPHNLGVPVDSEPEMQLNKESNQ